MIDFKPAQPLKKIKFVEAVVHGDIVGIEDFETKTIIKVFYLGESFQNDIVKYLNDNWMLLKNRENFTWKDKLVL